MNFILKHKLTFIGLLIGAAGGYAYYHFVGCVSGTCSITSKPLNSSMYGALMGGLLLSNFNKNKKNEDHE